MSNSMPKPTVVAPIEEQVGVLKGEEAKAKSDSEVVVKSYSSGIKVVALQNGFFNNKRIKEGDEFLIGNEGQLGRWMRCLNPEMQKKHEANMEKKKKAGK